jgi:hypothetical protein
MTAFGAAGAGGDSRWCGLGEVVPGGQLDLYGGDDLRIGAAFGSGDD